MILKLIKKIKCIPGPKPPIFTKKKPNLIEKFVRYFEKKEKELNY